MKYEDGTTPVANNRSFNPFDVAKNQTSSYSSISFLSKFVKKSSETTLRACDPLIGYFILPSPCSGVIEFMFVGTERSCLK